MIHTVVKINSVNSYVSNATGHTAASTPLRLLSDAPATTRVFAIHTRVHDVPK